MPNTIDLITINDEKSAVFINRQRVQASDNLNQMNELAHKLSESLTHDDSFNHYQVSADNTINWDMAEKSIYKAIDNGTINDNSSVQPEDDVPEFNDEAALDNELEGLAKGMRSAFNRSIQRMAAFDSNTMGKYFNSAVVTLGGTLSMYGALNGNPLLAEYLSEIATTTIGAASMSIYGAGVAVAASANQSLIKKLPAYQDKINQHLMSKIDKTLAKEGLRSANDLTPKQKAEFSEVVKIHYGTEQGAEMATALMDMHKLEREPHNKADNQRVANSDMATANNPGARFGR